uniref:Uncharacterized protein n=1 Tax=Auxenochlorella protothecoides TaxID=3075 RepID=A0A1D1ZNI5_AUXPR
MLPPLQSAPGWSGSWSGSLGTPSAPSSPSPCGAAPTWPPGTQRSCSSTPTPPWSLNGRRCRPMSDWWARSWPSPPRRCHRICIAWFTGLRRTAMLRFAAGVCDFLDERRSGTICPAAILRSDWNFPGRHTSFMPSFKLVSPPCPTLITFTGAPHPALTVRELWLPLHADHDPGPAAGPARRACLPPRTRAVEVGGRGRARPGRRCVPGRPAPAAARRRTAGLGAPKRRAGVGRRARLPHPWRHQRRDPVPLPRRAHADPALRRRPAGQRAARGGAGRWGQAGPRGVREEAGRAACGADAGADGGWVQAGSGASLQGAARRPHPGQGPGRRRRAGGAGVPGAGCSCVNGWHQGIEARDAASL